jgi:hypothetical protein
MKPKKLVHGILDILARHPKIVMIAFSLTLVGITMTAGGLLSPHEALATPSIPIPPPRLHH